jgi:hypothetical protein
MLMSEYQLWPLRVSKDGSQGNYAPSEVDSIVTLSPELACDIESWDEKLQDTYVGDDPSQYGFTALQDQEQFIAQGRELARRIKQEAGSAIVVEYAGDGSIPTETIQ